MIRSQVSPSTLMALRALGGVAGIVIAGSLSIVCAERVQEFWFSVVCLAGLWLTYLVLCWHRPAALLLPVSLGFCFLGFALVAENLLSLESVLGFRVSNKLDLSPRLVRLALNYDHYRTRSWEQYGADPLFYRLKPGSRYRERYDYRNVGEEYEAIVDDIGFLNADRSYYTRHDRIEVFLVGDSVMQGIGMPGVIEALRPLVPVTIYSLATGSYSPRQKVQALREFALPKQPRWLVLEFYGGNDASEIIEDEVCDRLHRDYRCRFDLVEMARGLSEDAEYSPMGDFGDFRPLMESLRTVRSDSLTLALGTGVARKARRVLTALRREQIPSYGFGRSLDGEAITLPGFTHYDIFPSRQLDWIKKGLDLTLQAYEAFRIQARQSGARVMLLYNPTSYEIYRAVLAGGQVSPLADEISRVQRQTLERYAREKGMEFCDLTEGFRAKVRGGARGLFGHYDGTHWSRKGTELAASVIAQCLNRLEGRGTETAEEGGR